MLYNATFNNIVVISWPSVLLWSNPEKTTNLPQVADKLDHIMLFLVYPARAGFELTTLVVIAITTTSLTCCN
jgi:hypothetical protein